MLLIVFSERFKVTSKNARRTKKIRYHLIRSRFSNVILTLAALTGFAVSTLANTSESPSSTEPYFERSEHYRSVDPQMLRELEQLFSDWLSPGNSADAGSHDKHGFRSKVLRDGILLLSDVESRGWGHFFLAPQRPSSVLLQAPHQFYDLRTGEIAVALFQQGAGKTLAMNSAHRYSQGKDVSHTDWAHLPSAPLNAFTRAFLNAAANSTVVQIHGYAETKRQSSAGRQSDVIISSGQRWPHPSMLNFAECLQQNTDWAVLRYPQDIGELGGTTNVQGRLMNSLGNPRFIHLELSSKLRKTLTQDHVSLQVLANCIRNIDPEDE